MNKRPTLDELEDMLVQVSNEGQGLSRWEREFIDDVRGQWETRRWMSIKQEEILTRIHKERVR